MGSVVISLLFLAPVLDGDNYSVSRPGLSIPRKTNPVLISQKGVWSQSPFRRCTDEKNTCRESNPSRGDRRSTLYRLRYHSSLIEEVK
jgi:hypothetical protein